MVDLFDRRATLQMGSIEVEGLRMAFKIEKTPSEKPNAADVSVWNLSRDTRGQLLDRTVPIVLAAGYADHAEQIFTGDIRPDGISTARSGGDLVTTFKAGDGAKTSRTARIQESLAKGTSAKDVIKKVTEAVQEQLGGGKSLAAKIADKVWAAIKSGEGLGAAFDEFLGGTTLSGNASDELKRVLSSFGFEHSIQDGHLQIVPKGGHTDEDAVVMSPSTGLVGSPEPGADGFTKWRSLLQPQLKPRRRALLETATYNGLYVVDRVTHVGDTHGPDWYTDCEGRPL